MGLALPLASVLSDLFALDQPVIEKVLRSVLVFAFLVVALRLGGKRELGQITTLDLAVLLLVSNALQNAMIGNDNTLIGGLIGASTLFLVNYGFVRLTFRSKRARTILEGSQRVLLEDGKVIPEALRREAIREDELRSAALERGFGSLDEVRLIVLETNGHMAIMGPEATKG